MLNSDRFLNAFSDIEQRLRKIAMKDRWLRFYELVDIAAESNSVVRTYRDDLREYANLRNAIVHRRIGGRVIAEPNDLAVEEIERIASLVLNPPTVTAFCDTQVYTLMADKPMAEAVSAMYLRSFSQVPVYDATQFTGLLTTNTVARWLGGCVKDDVLSLEETLVRDVLTYTEDEDNHVFLSRSATLFDVLETFHGYERKGKRLEAILITANGKVNEALLGIITVWDLPRISEVVGG